MGGKKKRSTEQDVPSKLIGHGEQPVIIKVHNSTWTSSNLCDLYPQELKVPMKPWVRIRSSAINLCTCLLSVSCCVEIELDLCMSMVLMLLKYGGVTVKLVGMEAD